jgi:HK97 family phage major capsid protein
MEFIKKSAEELKNMGAVELQNYYVEKLTNETSELKSKVSELEALKEDSKAYAEKSIEVQEANDSKIQSLQEAVVAQGIVSEKVRSGAFSGSQMRDLEGSIEKALSENVENFKNSAEGRVDFSFNLDTKAVGDMTFSNNVTGTVPQARRLDGVNDIAERVAQAYSRIPKLMTSGNTIEWVYETAQEGAAAGTAEGAAKNQIDNNFVVTNIPLIKQTAYFKLSTEMLTEAQWMASWIRNKLIVRLFLRIDSQALVGGGTGTDLNGLYTQATTFAAGTFALAVDNANDVDSLVVAMNQIRIANHGQTGLTIFMHPSDVTALKMVKVLSSATDQRYVNRLADIASNSMLEGAPIVQTTAMAQGTFLVSELSKAFIAEQGSIKVDVGLDGNDFTENKRTILAEWKGEVVIETNDVTAHVKGTFATTNAALETT